MVALLLVRFQVILDMMQELAFLLWEMIIQFHGKEEALGWAGAEVAAPVDRACEG